MSVEQQLPTDVVGYAVCCWCIKQVLRVALTRRRRSDATAAAAAAASAAEAFLISFDHLAGTQIFSRSPGLPKVGILGFSFIRVFKNSICKSLKFMGF